MTPFKPNESDFQEVIVDGKRRKVLSRAKFDAFNASLLGLGDLARAATVTDAVAAVFELEDFPGFCKQTSTDLAMPFFIKEFLTWLMDELKMEMKRKDHGAGVILWSPLPFFVKFTGEGLLVLWDASGESDVARRNIIANALVICGNYRRDFLFRIRGKAPDSPPVLRCALARSTVYSVGEGHDYAGSCILMAARLQRLHGVTFCFDSRGFNLKDADKSDWIRREVIVKQVSSRGIGEDELIGILRSESRALKRDEKKQFKPQ